ncbi:MAG TPA: crosslink repair DNA glycosylase YcaQ family protein [Candidatus Acidoferrum sp.]|nr:crosslink repair DNA glycosylase YcaQ family protein [Candidatus Acidoferrum sp.]
MATKVNGPLHVYPVALSNDELNDLWRWLLWRQGVGQRKFDTAVEIADKTLGLHAARLPSPFATVLARASQRLVSARFFTTEQEQLITVRCMRKTLHMLPLPLAAQAHSATLHFRERDTLRRAINEGVDTATLERCLVSLVNLLEQEGQLPHRDLEVRLAGKHFSVSAARLALKMAWERGLVIYRNVSGGWNSEARQFVLTEKLFPGFALTIDRQEATTSLVRHYFDRYGPASVADMMWWSGLSQGAIVEAMNVAGTEWVSVVSPWSPSALYMLPERLKEFYASKRHIKLPLNLLAHEDVALKAYADTRKRYLGDLAPERIFNPIGEVLPAILNNGQVVGKWFLDARERSVHCDVFPEYSAHTDSAVLDKLAQRYTRLLNMHTVR